MLQNARSKISKSQKIHLSEKQHFATFSYAITYAFLLGLLYIYASGGIFYKIHLLHMQM